MTRILLLFSVLAIFFISACQESAVDPESPEDIKPDTFYIVLENISDKLIWCEGHALSEGELQVTILDKDSIEIADYNDFSIAWYTGDNETSNPIEGETGATLSNLDEGFYTLRVTDSIERKLQASTYVSLIETIPQVTVNVLANQTQAEPPNGVLEAVVEGGSVGYNFSWEDALGPIGVYTSTAVGLQAGMYTVRISKNGCEVSASGTILEDF